MENLNDTLKEQEAKLRELGQQEIQLPAGVMMGYATRRTELVRLAGANMKQAEVKAVLDTLAGEMEMSDAKSQIILTQKRIIAGLQKAMETTTEVFSETMRTLRKAQAGQVTEEE